MAAAAAGANGPGEDDSLVSEHEDGAGATQASQVSATPATQGEKRARAGTGAAVSRLPVVLPPSARQGKPCVLLQGVGTDLDVSGDVGTIGRLNIEPSCMHVTLDLKGTVYQGHVLPGATSLILAFDATEARVTSVVNEHVWLTPRASVFTSETVVEGALDPTLFDDLDVDVNTKEGRDVAAAEAADAEQPKQSGKAGKGKASKTGKAASTPAKRRAPSKAGKTGSASKPVKRRKRAADSDYDE